MPVGDGRHGKDMTSLEEKISVIILATDDTFRRFGFLMGSTKSSE
jgi:hypothetical protein